MEFGSVRPVQRSPNNALTNNNDDDPWQSLNNAREHGEDFKNFFNKLEYNAEKYADTFCSPAETAHQQFHSFAEIVFKDLLISKLATNNAPHLYRDYDSNGYVATEKDGHIYLKQLPNKAQYTFPINSYPGQCQPEHQNSDPHTFSIRTLLTDNPYIIVQLANHISTNRADFPPSLAKLAEQCRWQIEHAKHKIGEPHFSLNRLLDGSNSLKSLLSQKSQPPLSDEQKCQLAWEICMRTTWTNNFLPSNQSDALLYYLLNDVKSMHLQLTPIKHGRRSAALISADQAIALQTLCNFLTRHFEGQSVSFSLFNDFGNAPTNGKSITALFNKNPNVKSLFFNKISGVDSAIKSISEAIEKNVSIEKLEITHSEITDKDAKILADAISKNSLITEVNLQGNGIKLNGALQLMSCNTITSLNLSGNGLSEDEAKAIANALENNHSLVWLDLRYPETFPGSGKRIKNIPTPETQEKIDELLERNRNRALFTKAMNIANESFKSEFPTELVRHIFELGIQAKNIPREKLNLPALTLDG